MDLPDPPDSLYHYEEIARVDGFQRIIGIDEAGRGPLAGPVVAAAVLLPIDAQIDGLADSKTLKADERDRLYDVLTALDGIEYSVIDISVELIDRHNILRATHMAMRRAASQISEPDLAFIDGLPVPNFPCSSRNVIKGDAKVACIAAAAILAKVTRDRMMHTLHLEFPDYGFDRHKGYGTAAHMEALRAHGPCIAHRRSFRPVADLLNPPPTQLDLEL